MTLVNNTSPTLFSAADGRVTTPLLYDGAFGEASIVQPDGKFLIAGEDLYGGDIAVVRYNADGSLDTTFGTGGKAIIVASPTELAFAIALQSDGRIVVAGRSSSGGVDSVVVARLTASGTPDSTFDGDGRAVASLGTADAAGYEVAIDSSGRIVVAGKASGATGPDFGVIRFNANGSLDTTFDGDGKVTTPVSTTSSPDDFADGLAIQSNGKIVVAGYTKIGNDYDVAVVRYNSDGSLDTSFNGSGKRSWHSLVTDANDYGFATVVQPDGKILVAGSSNRDGTEDFLLIRLNSDGSYDTSFGTPGLNGGVVTPVGNSTDTAYTIALQADGKILLGGYVDVGGDNKFGIVRYTSSGALDTSFGTGGKVILNIGANGDDATSVLVLPDGKILVTGDSENGVVRELAAIRLNADGSVDTTFGTTNHVEGGAAVVIDENMYLYDGELYNLGNYGGATLQLNRQGGPNAQDVFGMSGAFSSITEGGLLKVNGSSIGTVNVNSGGKLLVTFNVGAQQSLVDAAIRQITYRNTSDAPPSAVTLDWTFSDGNTGSQGQGGALGSSASTVVHITGINDAPVIQNNGSAASASVSIVENGTLVMAINATDPDSSISFGLAGTDAGKFVLVGNQLHFAAKRRFRHPQRCQWRRHL